MEVHQPAALDGPEIGSLQGALQDAGAGHINPRRLDLAVNGLRRLQPEQSAAQSLTPRQRRVIFHTGLLGTAFWFVAPELAWYFSLSVLSLAFAMIVLIRLVALWQLVWNNSGRLVGEEMAHTLTALPPYTLLVPLHREASVAAGLVKAMQALDYPTDQLEIMFITESDDDETRAALRAAGLRSHMHVVTVPEGRPRTKPRALNYGLTFARGEFVGIYDAEDVPEPGQLRAAVAAFRNAGNELVCVQARLSIYNPGRNFLTRQFTLEYAALFDGILPAFEKLGLPLPLGGTSNHFRRLDLERAGAWDPFNVTEDADLGIRLARSQVRVAMLDSVTWEEAPDTLAAWFAQRTRWIKGWMQTYLVHMRSPIQLWRELGAWRFLGIQLIFGGLILSALAHPFFYVAVLSRMDDGTLLQWPVDGLEALLWWTCCFNVFASYASSIALVAMAVARRGGRLLIGSALGLPFYWFAISLASYKALAEIVTRPHFWAKTPHKGLGRDALVWPRHRDDAVGL
jgi:glycosyltransferase XagB